MDKEVKRGLGLLIVGGLVAAIWLAGGYAIYGVVGAVCAVIGLLFIARNLLSATE